MAELLKPPKLCLFDLDGTLVHHENEHFFQSATEIYKSMGREMPTAEKFYDMLNRHDLFSDINSIDRRAFQEEFWKRFEKLDWPLAREIEGALITLEKFVIAGSKVAIVTARTQLPEEVEHCLHPTGLLKHIDVVSTLGEPHLLNRISSPTLKVPQIKYVCKKIGVAPKESLIAGDSPADITSGKQAGVTLTIGLLSGGVVKDLLLAAKPDLLTESVDTMRTHFHW